MAVRDYMIGSFGMHGKAARKTRVRSLQEPDTSQYTFGQKLVFTRSHNPNNVSLAKKVRPSLDLADKAKKFWPFCLISKDSSDPT